MCLSRAPLASLRTVVAGQCSRQEELEQSFTRTAVQVVDSRVLHPCSSCRHTVLRVHTPARVKPCASFCCKILWTFEFTATRNRCAGTKPGALGHMRGSRSSVRRARSLRALALDQPRPNEQTTTPSLLARTRLRSGTAHAARVCGWSPRESTTWLLGQTVSISGALCCGKKNVNAHPWNTRAP